MSPFLSLYRPLDVARERKNGGEAASQQNMADANGEMDCGQADEEPTLMDSLPIGPQREPAIRPPRKATPPRRKARSPFLVFLSPWRPREELGLRLPADRWRQRYRWLTGFVRTSISGVDQAFREFINVPSRFFTASMFLIFCLGTFF